jgi:serine/threonine protein kinase
VSTEVGRGTSGYRPPELIDYNERGMSFTTKVDIWGLGCVLYELVVGKRPFGDDWGVLQYSDSDQDLQIYKSSLPETYNSHLHYLINELLHRNYKARPFASELLPLFRSYILVSEHTESGQDETQLILPTYAQWKQEVLAYNEEEGDFWSYLSRFITFETSKATVAVKSLVDAPSLSPGPTPDLLSISEDIEVMDGDYVEFYDEEAAVVSRVVLEFPRNVCMLIDQYQTKLAELVSPFDAEYHVEAGYDIIPNGCSLASPEQYASFQGIAVGGKRDAYIV